MPNRGPAIVWHVPALSGSGRDETGPVSSPGPIAPSYARIAGLVLRSALLPGSGHLATGHRRSGRVLLAVALLLLAGLVAGVVVLVLSPPTAASAVVRPDWLTALLWGAPAVAVFWIASIASAAVLARPGARGWPGRLVAGAVAAVLVAAVAVPAAVVTRYAQVQLGFVQGVFHDSRAQAGGDGGVTPPEVPLRNGRLNVLLVGSDAGPDRTGVRTDTVVLASLDTRSGRTVLFTLPRNLERVPFVPGSVMAGQFPRGFSCGDACLLNAVYGWAVDHADLFPPGDPDPGMTALRSAVAAVLGIPVDYYASVDLAGFETVVDALGGVTIRVERRLPIGGLDADSNHVRPSGYIEPGLQHMSGETALAYARSRSDSSDYERVQRQRCLLGGLQRQADPRQVLANFQQVTSSAADALTTDVPRDLLPDLVKLAFKVKAQPVLSLTFTPPLVNVVRPDFDAIRAAVQAALQPAGPAPSPPAATTPPAGPAPSAGPPAAPSPGVTNDATPVPVDAVCAYQ